MSDPTTIEALLQQLGRCAALLRSAHTGAGHADHLRVADETEDLIRRTRGAALPDSTSSCTLEPPRMRDLHVRALGGGYAMLQPISARGAAAVSGLQDGPLYQRNPDGSVTGAPKDITDAAESFLAQGLRVAYN